MSYNYNLKFFDEINEESSYFIGLLFADGSISNKGKITLNLSKKDIEIIEIFKQKLKTNKPIFSVKKTNSLSFSFQNKIISEQLNNFGLIPNKSLILKFSDKIPNEYLKDYIRGYFDGDGCVSITKNKHTSSLRVHFVGTYEMLEGIQNILINELNITKTKINQLTKGKNTFQFEIRRKNGDRRGVFAFTQYSERYNKCKNNDIQKIEIINQKWPENGVMMKLKMEEKATAKIKRGFIKN
jgi:intein-encoded DNA endonuclease-like protein